MKTKNKKEPERSWVEIQSDYNQKLFDELSKELVWQLTDGGGSRNIHVLSTLRNMEWAYLSCAAYKMAAENEKKS